MEIRKMNANAVENKLSLLVNEILTTIPDVDKIYLFGSYAYGNPTKDSDFDIMVITKNELGAEDIFDKKVNIRHNLFDTVDDFDMIIYSSEIFNRRKQYYSFEEKIFNQGKLLYEI